MMNYLNNKKKENVLRLLTEPIVTQKEYRNTIEVLKEVFDHYDKHGSEEDKIKLLSYSNVIRDLKRFLKP